MANQTLTTNPVTFLDYTDERKLDVYISSNFPTTQIFDTNAKTYSPNWSTTNPLVLTADVYLDAKDVTADVKTEIKWFEQVGVNSEVEINYGDTLIIDSNKMSSNALLTYICKAKYADNGDDSPAAIAKLTFTRVDTGLNGSNGSSAPAVQAQYSADGSTSWTSALNTATHKYIRYSYDGGKTWTVAIKIVGEDGTSVNIKGTATSKSSVSGTSYYTLVYNSAPITGAAIGDAYLLDGDLYVCVDSRDGNDYFMYVGHIQGPQGNDGQSSYVFIRYATDANGSNMSVNPSSTTTHIGICTVNTNVAPTTTSSYTWSKFVGDSAKSLILNGDAQVFKVGKDKAYAPSTIKVTAQRINIPTTASLTWYYNGSTTMPSKGVTKNGDVITIAGSDLTTDYLTIKVSDGTVEDVFTVYKAFDGLDGSKGNDGQPASIAFLTNENVSFSANANGVVTAAPITANVVAYNGITKQMPTIGKILGAPSGMTITTRQDTSLNEVELTISFTAGTDLGSSASTSDTITIPVTSPVETNLKLSWSKINAGAKGDKGDKGGDAYTVMLTNESYIFAGDVDHAYVDDVTTQIIGYKGATQQSITISSVNGKTAAIVDTDTGITGLKFKCSALSDTSPTITFTCAETFTSASGFIPIVVSVDGVSFTRMFNYSIAFKGATGGMGAQGPQGTAASLVDITPSAHYFKSTTGKDGTFTPDYIYLYPRFQTVAFSKWEYSVNGGATWVAASGANGLSISEYNSVKNTLRIARTSALYTDTVTSISFRCVSSNTSVYDTVSIAKIYDVVDLQIGGRNLILASDVSYSNSEYRVASYNMSEDWELNATYTLTLKGTIQEGKIFGAWANGSGTRVATLSYDATRGVYMSTFTTPATIANQTPKVINIYNTPSTTAGSASIEWVKLEKGNKATDWSPAPEDLKSITFQLYAPKGYLITNDVPSVTLEAFAYDGSQAITNATFTWSSWNGESWIAISGATSTSLALNASNIFKSGIYKCDMAYGGKVYTATATVEDKTDIYDSLIHVTSKYSPTNRLYWILYSTVYSDEGEKDALLGPISVTAPETPATGAYWYKIDETNYTVTLMKYSGSAWATTTDKQAFVYDWFMLNDTNNIVTLGEQSKVKIVTSDKFSRTCSVQCNVLDQERAALTHSNQVLNDPSDPIISTTEPSNPINGQLWIKTGTNGSYTLLVWDGSSSKWVISEADSQKRVYVSKPMTYNDGDMWIVAADYEPDSYINGILQTEVVNGTTKTIKHLAGTMLRAQYASQTYKDADWVEALNYNKEFNDINKQLSAYNQFFTFDTTGMTMGAKDVNGQISEFSTKLTNTELGFYQGATKVAYINNNQLNISKAEITNGMLVGGDAPMIQIGNFVLIQESNGSLSIGLKS